MEYQSVIVNVDNGIAVLTINREGSLNALNKSVFDDLDLFFTKGYLEIPVLKGVVITGAGLKAFAAGADIKEFMNFAPAEAQALSKRGHDVFYNIERFHRPVIAAVNGFALGGGCELALSCHIRIAGEKAKFGLPEVNLGLVPGYGATQRMHQIVGKAKALELMMTSDIVGAEEAYRIGLANHVVPAGEEVNKATEMIEKIGSKGPNAVAAIIQLSNIYYNKEIDGFHAEQEVFGKMFGTKESNEGITAFLEKRSPKF
ncbi:MAG TPA: enoyl-CoA hydratase-related protein [Saprospiraceae bacterium]|nr:enoyl-CoA hydratase-related protein [Saprospiraceae bacterium]